MSHRGGHGEQEGMTGRAIAGDSTRLAYRLEARNDALAHDNHIFFTAE
jgi:hypothetical protein